MATLKLKTPAPKGPRRRPPVRGRGSAPWPQPTVARPPGRSPIESPAKTRPEPAARDPFESAGPPPVNLKAVPRRPTGESLPFPRLAKRMSELGLASRREADEWIARGWVRVNGRVERELGVRVAPDARIELDPQARSEQRSRITIVLHKPLGYVSGQAEDGHAPAVTLIRPEARWAGDRSGVTWDPSHLRYLAPAGRLDLDSTGLLIFTQDGRVARRLIGEDTSVDKAYQVQIEPMTGAAPVTDAQIALLRHGLSLDEEPLKPAEVERLGPDSLRFVLRQGKKRQIRRMCEAVGQRVVALQRVRIGPVTLGDLPPGQWRYLGEDESLC